jgi:radical SAM protein with 4Fe4S-binding SPASM domain
MSVLPMWTPFITPDYIVRRPNSAKAGPIMIIDPWTQHWAIVSSQVEDILPFVDGHRTVPEIAAAARFNNIPEFDNEDLLRGLLEQLRSAGLVYSSEAHQRSNGNPVYSTVSLQGLHLEITNACNLQCAHCYVSSGRKLPNELTTDELKSVIDQLTPFSQQTLVISGGEPVVRKDCMQLVEYAAIEKGLRVDLYSNAYKFPQKFAQHLVAINDAGPGSVRLQVSIEGADARTNDAVRGPGSFEQIERSMAMFRALGLHRKLTLFACVTRANIAQIDQMIRLAERWDVEKLVFSQWQRQGNAIDTPWRSIAPSKEEWCAAGEKLLKYNNPRLLVQGNFFGDLNNNESGRYSTNSALFPKHLYAYNAVPRVSPDGMIFADQFWTTPDWSLGNVRDMTLQEAFQTEKYHQQITAFRHRSNNISECRECPWLRLCESGSPGHTYAEYGDLNRRDLFCESRIYWFERYVSQQFAKLAGAGA